MNWIDVRTQNLLRAEYRRLGQSWEWVCVQNGLWPKLPIDYVTVRLGTRLLDWLRGIPTPEEARAM